MADKVSISSIRLSPVDNGFILSWDVQTKKDDGSTYGNCSYDYKQEVYKSSEGATATKRMMALAKQAFGMTEEDGEAEKIA